MTNLQDDSDQVAADLKAEISKPETMRRLLDLVAPRLKSGGRNLVYILAQVERIGHLAMEPFFLKSLHGAAYDRIIVITGKLAQPGVNPAVLEATGREFVHVETDDPVLPVLGFFDGGMLDMKILHMLLVQPQRLARDFALEIVSGRCRMRHFSLTGGQRERGDAWMRAIGAGPDEPFVVLHVRDAGYMPEKAHHLFRCADIANYGPAIDRLVAAGYRVFRLGDASSPRLEHPSGRVVDVPHTPDYKPFLDVYLSARCAFALNQASGPEALARAFGRPALTVNLVPEHLRLPLPDDLLVFKHFRRRSDGSELSYAEMLDQGLPAFGTSEAFEKAGLLVEENSAEELDAAVGEMIARVNGDSVPDPALQERFRSIGRPYEARIKVDPECLERTTDFYAYAHPFGALSESFLALNPGFLR